jgi:putative phosphoserine phosphatase/1-acylglycerol-3-phosphate O-acyltransferase
MSSSAAFFDLDRTLLTTSSATSFNEAMLEVGLTTRGGIPGQGLLMRFYELAGETLPAMALARAAVVAVRGKKVADVAAAAERGGELVEGRLAPFARYLLDTHRQAGRPVVLATTTPVDLVAPLARRLGFDDVVATRYATAPDADGVERYTGRLDGGFCWSLGKVRAVRRWADDHAVDLGASYAYSDSVYDLPLLGAVGHPTAVNPDFRLLPTAVLARWPIVHLDAPAGVPKLLGLEPLDLVKLLFPRHAFPYARWTITGTEHLPRHGGVVLAANHRSWFDPVALAMAVFDAGRHPRFVGRRELLDAPVVGTLARTFGAILTDGDGPEDDADAFEAARDALAAGEVVIVLPQGSVPEGRAFFEPRLHGRTAAARLAAATGSPLLPVGLWGTEEVWPRSSRLPLVHHVFNPPTVSVRIGEPLQLRGRDPGADTEAVMAAISDLLPPQATIRRIPTVREVRRFTPPAS